MNTCARSVGTEPPAPSNIADSGTEEWLSLQGLLGFGRERLGLLRGFLEEQLEALFRGFLLFMNE